MEWLNFNDFNVSSRKWRSIFVNFFYHKITARFFCVPEKRWPQTTPFGAENMLRHSQKYRLTPKKVPFYTLKGNLLHPNMYLFTPKKVSNYILKGT